MLVRQVVIPVSPSELWNALTEPEEVAAWFGSRVEWDLRPGGQARFLSDDGAVRGGVVDDVVPQRHLSFRWWPEGDDGSAASQVSYDLEPDDDGTLLTVTEEPRPHEATVEPQASLRTTGSWTGWDTRLLRCWAAHMSVAAPVAAGGRAVR